MRSTGGIVKFNVVFADQNDVFFSGQTVNGYCDIELIEPIRSVVVRCKGQASVSWSELVSKSKNTYSETHTLIHFDSFYNHGSFTPGCIHRLPFQFELPENLPSSLENPYGNIRYWIEAQNSDPAALYPKVFVVPIKIFQPINTNIWQYRFPVQGDKEKGICCCCCPCGRLSIEAHTDRAAYCPDEIVTIAASFRNNSTRKVTPYVKLVEKFLLQAEGQNSSQISEYDLEPLIGSPESNRIHILAKGGATTWKAMQFRIPSEVTPSVTPISCVILNVTHEIVVGLSIPWAKDLRVLLPIVVGTIPFRGQTVTLFMPKPINEGEGADLTTAGTGKPTGSTNQLQSSFSGIVERPFTSIVAPPEPYKNANSPILPPPAGFTDNDEPPQSQSNQKPVLSKGAKLEPPSYDSALVLESSL